MHFPSPEELAIEAHWIHRALFSTRCPEEILNLYLEANHQFKDEIYLLDCSWIQRAARKGISPVSLEYFMRVKNPGNSLSKKMKMILYFCEVDPEYRDKFKNDADRGVISYFILMGLGMASLSRFVLGALSYIIYFYGRRQIP